MHAETWICDFEVLTYCRCCRLYMLELDGVCLKINCPVIVCVNLKINQISVCEKRSCTLEHEF
jgi:hypothetical protein